MDKRVLHTVLEAHANTHAQSIAIEHHQREISYQALDNLSNTIANQLLALDMPKSANVALLLPSGIEYVAALLGTLKSGGVFVPLTLEFPDQRLNQVLDICEPDYLITGAKQWAALQQRWQQLPQAAKIKHIMVVNETDELALWQDGSFVAQPANEQTVVNRVDGDDPCYIIFTSGSTGTPKAILGRHKGLSHFIHWEQKAFEVSDKVRVSQLAPVTFDVSLRDILLPLFCGGTLCVADDAVKMDIQALLRWLNNSQVSHIHMVPSMLRLLMKELAFLQPEERLPALERIILAGEPLYGKDVLALRELVGQRVDVVNMYGPSETTLAKLFHRVSDVERPNAILPLGQPIANTAVLILKRNRLCDIGEIGEIYIKTPFRSLGYYKNEALNQAAFVQNPLQQETDILYKTGDLGRYLPDRSIEFAGRSDRQVKVNGNRIELDEIEAALRNHPAIEQAYAQTYAQTIKNDDEELTLVCYFTASETLDDPVVNQFLRSMLPEYMLPSFYLQLDKMPLNLNGKVDRKKLPKPEQLMFAKVPYVAAQTPMEQQIVTQFQHILGLDKVGIDHSFFEIGGNSLRAVKLVSAIYHATGLELALKQLFETPTVRELAAVIERREADSKSDGAEYQAIPQVAAQPNYPVSNAQKRLWFVDKLVSDPTAFNLFGLTQLLGELDISAFEQAWTDIIARHESLRSYFTAVDSQPRQVILDTAPFSLPVIRLAEIKRADQEMVASYEALEAYQQFVTALDGELEKSDIAALWQLIEQQRQHRFLLEQPQPLLVITLVAISDDNYLLLSNMHHIVADGWSMHLMVQELLAFYRQHIDQQPADLQPLAIQYKDYAAWQLEQGASLATAKAYWHDYLAGELPYLELPLDHVRPPQQSFQGASAYLNISEAQLAGLQGLCEQGRGTLFMVLASSVSLLLHHYSGQREVRLGYPMANRRHPALAPLIGFFINTLVYRSQIDWQQGFKQYFAKAVESFTQSFEHQDYPFDRLVEELGLAADASRSPLFDVLLILQNNEQAEFAAEGLAVKEIELAATTAQYDLTFHFTEHNDGLKLELNYCTALFDASRIQAMLNHFSQLIDQLIAEPEIPVGRLNLLTDAEVRQQWLEFNHQPVDIPLLSVGEAFSRKAKEYPEHIALVFGEQQQSYAELERQSNALALWLQSQLSSTATEQPVVAVWMRRGMALPQAMLSIMKAGYIYLPIEADYPDDRIRYLLEDSKPALVLVDSAMLERATALNKQHGLALSVHNIESLTDLNTTTNAEMAVWPQPDALAYMIYTSGSTGLPKGVLVPQRGLINLTLAQSESLAITKTDRVLQFASVGFDVSLNETFLAWLNGACLVIAERDSLSHPKALSAFLQHQAISVLACAPGLLELIAAENGLESLRVIMTGGEPPNTQLAKKLAHDKRYINAYGPTENSVCSTMHQVDATRDYSRGIPIGCPLANHGVMVVGPCGEPVPVGVTGELVVFGQGLAAGYLNQPELTQRQFMDNPYHTERWAEGRASRFIQRLMAFSDAESDWKNTVIGQSVKGYKTGDRVRFNVHGELEFMGRVDEQVKVRGHRVELGEVSAALQAVDGIREVSVLAVKDRSEQVLVAYYVGDEMSQAQIRSQLSARLPNYMLPGYVHRLAAMPLTVNGKVDTSALPTLAELKQLAQLKQLAEQKQRVGLKQNGGYDEQPATQKQAQLQQLFADILQIKQVPLAQSFFELGGHSLLAIKLLGRLQQQFEVEVSLASLYTNSSVLALSELVEASEQSQWHGIPQIGAAKYYPLSHAQQRLWVMDKIEERLTAYNVFGVTRLKGTLDTQAFEQAWRQLIARHEILRTRFIEVDATPYQLIESGDDFTLSIHQLSDLPAASKQASGYEVLAQQLADSDLSNEQIASLHDFIRQQSGHCFDLSGQPPVNVDLVVLGEGDYLLVCNLHHIVTDGWSMAIMVDELLHFYQQASEQRHTEQKDAEQKEADLPALPIQYKDYAAWQRQQLEDGKLDSAKAYWHGYLEGELPQLNLMTDWPRPSVQQFEGASAYATWSPQTLKQIEQLGQASGAGLFATLTSIISVYLHHASQQQELLLGYPVANREHPDIEPLVGFFVNTLVYRSQLDWNTPFNAYLATAAEQMAQGIAHQNYPFDRLVDELNLSRDLSRPPLFNVMLALQNTRQSQFDVPDLAVETIQLMPEVSQFDLTYHFAPSADGLGIELNYNKQLFSAARVEQMLQQLDNLVQHIVAQPDTAVGQLSLLDSQSAAALWLKFNPARRSYPAEQSLATLFEQQAAQTPDAIAVETASESLSYSALNQRANGVAKYLSSQLQLAPYSRVAQASRVALLMPRGAEYVEATLGILKAGLCYVPLEKDFPLARLSYIVEDSQATVLIVDSSLKALADDLCANLPGVTLVEWQSMPRTPIAANPATAATGDASAYIMYTSGTTGQPKGVEALHRNITRVVLNTDYLSLGAESRVLQLSNVAFDGSTFDMYGALLNGSCLCIPSADVTSNLAQLSDFIRRHHVNTTFITTALFNSLVDLHPEVFEQFSTILFGGQACSNRHIAKALKLVNDPQVLRHVYGPTETTVFATALTLDAELAQNDLTKRRISLGQPIHHTGVLILNRAGLPVPMGVVGEVAIFGDGLARGYVNKPDKTEDVFIPNPFYGEQTKDSSLPEHIARRLVQDDCLDTTIAHSPRYYRSGDLGWINAQGQLEYIGRLDEQVKIRGFRIELGDVENALSQLPEVQESCVVAAPNDDNSGFVLVAHIASASVLAVKELQAQLKAIVPDYMVPSYFNFVTALPVTVNGKVNKKALPDLSQIKQRLAESLDHSSSEHFEHPYWPMFVEILNYPGLSPEDNFFAVGGDSIKAIQIASKILQAGGKLDVKHIFQQPCIANALEYVESVTPQDGADVEQVGEVAMLPIQHWFFETQGFFESQGFFDTQALDNKVALSHFNQSTFLLARTGLDGDAIELALNALVKQHDALRFSYQRVAESWQQHCLPADEVNISLSRYAINNLSEIVPITETLQQQIDLAEAPLMVAGLIRCPDGDRLYLAIHHLVIDGVSWRILLDDLAHFYQQATFGQEIKPLPRTLSAGRYVVHVEALAQSKSERAYWHQLAQQAAQNSEPNHGYFGDKKVIRKVLSQPLTEALFEQANQAFNTEINDLLLAALAMAHQQHSGENQLLLTLEGHGRESLQDGIDLSRTLGWFTAMYPVLLHCPSDACEHVAEHIKQLKESLRNIPSKGLGYGAMRYLAKDDSVHIAPHIGFNFLGRFQSQQADGLFEVDNATAVASDISPQARAFHALDFSLIEQGNGLEVNLFYDTQTITQDYAHQLLQAYVSQLEAIIAFCVGRDDTEITPSDVDADVSMDDLDSILGQL